MKFLTKSSIILLSVFMFAGCGKDPVTAPDPEAKDPTEPEAVLRSAPDRCVAATAASVIALATVAEGNIASVTLYYNDGKEKSVTMPATSEKDEYSGSFTVPAEAGSTVTYYVEALTAAGKGVRSETITLTVVAEDIVTEDPAEKLRLNEIGAYSGYEFVEIYNPTGELVSLAGVELWKNGVMLAGFKATHRINARNYGIFRAKDNVFTIPTGVSDLGSTASGLSGSKSLSLELRYKGEVLDAFANTANPGVGQMTPDDWDGEVEHPSGDYCNFYRMGKATAGWYAGSSTKGTPGTVSTIAGTRLGHQLLAADAVADVPYISGVNLANGGTPVKGFVAGTNTVRFKVYADLHNPSVTVTSSAGTIAKVEGVEYELSVSFSSGSASGTAQTITLTAVNAKGDYSKPVEVLVFPAAQTFAAYASIRLNEIQTSDGDAIELYNTSSDPVVIAGMRIRKNKDSVFTVPGYMILKGKGFAVLGCNGKNYNGTALNLGTIANGLSGSKALLIELRKPKIEGDLTNSTNIDSFVNTSYSNPTKDSPWDEEGKVEKIITLGVGRKTDGTGEWYQFSKMSIGSSNSASNTTGTVFTRKYTQTGGDE